MMVCIPLNSLLVIPELDLQPELSAEIEYHAKSAEGKVRHPFF
jgi:hypothetical protein